ncbi:MAG TPA: hypothetical protein VFS21_13390 [Roseiflexaceae bacterium]|nr:hypothetical protein [Roseiflexaceae bacterium]
MCAAFGAETTIPVLPALSLDATLDFYQALGFDITYRQAKPYVYGAVRRGGIELHFGSAPPEFDPQAESSGCLVMVDELAPYHQAFTAALRGVYGKVPASGRPRITRFRPSQSRFTVVDPSGNNVIYIQRDEPALLEYGGAKHLTGLAKALDNARIFRDFKNDDAAAARVLDSALAKHGTDAPKEELVRALAARAELAVALGEVERGRAIREQLRGVVLASADRDGVADELRAAEDLERWLKGQDEGDQA